MLKYSMKNHRVFIDPVSLTLECLREIYTADKTSVKKEATDLLTYIHVCSQVDQDAPFAKVDPMEIGPLVKREIYGTFEHVFKGKFNQEYLDNAIMSYQMAFDSAPQAAVRVYDKKIYEITRLIDETVIEIKPVAMKGGIEYVSNFPIINKMMQDMTKINAAREALKAAVMKQQTTNTVRGQKQVSFLERRRSEMIKAGVRKGVPDPGSEEEDMD